MPDITLSTGTAPALETERMRLRAHRLEDLDACVAMWADPIVTRHIGGKPFTREETWSKIMRYAGHWALIPPAHGKGLATEAVRAICAWGDQNFGSTSTVCMIDPENIASAWVAKKCGYQEFRRATYKDHSTMLYRRQP